MKLKILHEIDQLLNVYEDAPNKSELDNRLKELGTELERLRKMEKNKKAKRLLSKGSDMTRDDIIWLLGNEVAQKQIVKALKIGPETFEQYKDNHSFFESTNKRRRWTTEEIALARKMAREGKTNKEIALALNRTYESTNQTLHKHRVHVKKTRKNIKDPEYLKYLDIAKKNGITSGHYWKRVKRDGWGYERAANEPVRGKRK